PMRLFLRLIFIPLISLLLPGTAWSQVETPLIPRKALFADSDKDGVQLSPDGKWISYLALSSAIMNIWVAPVGDPSKASAVTKQSGAPVLNYRWTYLPGLLLYSASAENGVHVYLLELEGREPRDLTSTKGVVAFVEKLGPDRAEEALLRVKDPDRSTFDYHRVNLRTGASEVVFKND